MLAYAGASLPLLISFVVSNPPVGPRNQPGDCGAEVVRTLVGSIGLIASVPITTWIASMLAVRTRSRPVAADEESDLAHSHSHHH